MKLQWRRKVRTLLLVACLMSMIFSVPTYAGVIQVIDYETGDFSQVYKELDGPNASVEIVQSPVRKGSYAMKATVTTDDRRAEVNNKYKRGTVGGKNWYGWSVYVPSDYPGDGRFDIISQFHDYHSSQPAWSKDGKAPTHVMVDTTNSILKFDLKYQSGFETVAHKTWNLGSYTKGAWHDFVMEIVWSHDSSIGMLKLWLNGVQMINYNGPTYMDYGSGNGPYFKMGNYKGSANWPGTSPRVFYFDEFRMGDANSSYSEVNPAPAVADIILDNGAAEFTGSWSSSTTKPNYYGSNYVYTTSGTGTKKMRWRPNIAAAGSYQVYYWLPSGDSNRATNAPFTVYYNGGAQTYLVNQQGSGGQWVLLGAHSFASGTGGYVELTNNANGTYVIGDAIKFVKVN